MPPKKKNAPKKKDPADDTTEQLYRLYWRGMRALSMRIPRKIEEKFSEIRDEKHPKDFEVLTIWEETVPEQFKCLVDAFATLKYNKLREIHLWQANIGDEGMRSLSTYLSENASVTVLDVTNDRIGFLGCDFIGKLVSPSTTCQISFLRLDYNNIGDAGIEAISQGLKWNKTVEKLSLAFCNIESPGARFLMEILIHINCKIKDINLQGNKLRNMGAVIVFRALLINKSVASLNFSDNQFGEEENVMDALKNLLQNNETLKTLDITGNGFYQVGGMTLLQIMNEAIENPDVNIAVNQLVLPTSLDYEIHKQIIAAQKNLKKKKKKKGKGKGKKGGKKKKR